MASSPSRGGGGGAAHAITSGVKAAVSTVAGLPRATARRSSARREAALQREVYESFVARNTRPLSTCRLRGHTASVRPVDICGDGSLAITGSDDGTVRVWDAHHGEPLHVFGPHPDLINAVSLSHNGLRAAGACLDRHVRTWNLETGGCLYSMFGAVSDINAVAMSAEGHVTVAGEAAGKVLLWRSECASPIDRTTDASGTYYALPPSARFDAHADASVTGVVLARDNTQHLVYSCGSDGRLCVSDLCELPYFVATEMRAQHIYWEGSPTRSSGGAYPPFNGLDVSNDGSVVAGACSDGHVYVFDVESRALIQLFKSHDSRACMNVALSGDAHTLASSGTDGTVRLFDLREKPVREMLLVRDENSLLLWGIALSNDGRSLVSSCSHNGAMVRHLAAP
jgi:WD40 repeat protein